MKNYNIKNLILFVFVYIIISTMIGVYYLNFLSIMLGINVAFAIIPMILIILIYKRLEKQDFKVDTISVVMFVVFIFFFLSSVIVKTTLNMSNIISVY